MKLTSVIGAVLGATLLTPQPGYCQKLIAAGTLDASGGDNDAFGQPGRAQDNVDRGVLAGGQRSAANRRLEPVEHRFQSVRAARNRVDQIDTVGISHRFARRTVDVTDDANRHTGCCASRDIANHPTDFRG